MLDIDHFKIVNDTHGHVRGRPHAHVGLRLWLKNASWLREGDVLLRYGGDEFLVLAAGGGPRRRPPRSASAIRRAVSARPTVDDGDQPHLRHRERRRHGLRGCHRHARGAGSPSRTARCTKSKDAGREPRHGGRRPLKAEGSGISGQPIDEVAAVTSGIAAWRETTCLGAGTRPVEMARRSGATLISARPGTGSGRRSRRRDDRDRRGAIRREPLEPDRRGALRYHASAHAETPSTAPLIHARGLTKRFGAFTAVDAIDFDVAPGESFGFLGPERRRQDLHDADDRLRLAGHRGHAADPGPGPGHGRRADPRPPRRRAAGGHARHGDLTVRENLVIYGRYFDLTRAEARRRADELLEFAQLAERAGDQVEPLSGGMKRRLTIARALINEPDPAARRADDRPRSRRPATCCGTASTASSSAASRWS